MVKPAGKRRQVDHLVERFRVSRRRVCGFVLLCRTTFYYRSHRKDDAPIRVRLPELAQARQRWGYQRLHVLLRREGWKVNKKRTYRIYREEGLSVRTKVRKKRGSPRVVPAAPPAANERWAMGFVHDQLMNGGRFRALTVVDTFTRERPVIAVDTSFKRQEGRCHARRTRGDPRLSEDDHGRQRHGVLLEGDGRMGLPARRPPHFIRPGKPVYIERFNGRLRDELLNAELFLDINDARRKIEAWRRDYNGNRPHTALCDMTPDEFAAKQRPSGEADLNLGRAQSAGRPQVQPGSHR